MVALLFYHSPIFSLIMMRIGAEDQELGQSIHLLSCFLLAGGITCPQVGSSESGALIWAVVEVFSVALEGLVSLEKELMKPLVSGSR
jgi:hypothetical protein